MIKNLNFLVKKEFKGSLLKCLDLALENAANYNDVSAIIDNTLWKRIETISYPGASLREAILNAFAHANYFIRSNIKLNFMRIRLKLQILVVYFKLHLNKSLMVFKLTEILVLLIF